MHRREHTTHRSRWPRVYPFLPVGRPRVQDVAPACVADVDELAVVAAGRNSAVGSLQFAMDGCAAGLRFGDPDAPQFPFAIAAAQNDFAGNVHIEIRTAHLSELFGDAIRHVASRQRRKIDLHMRVQLAQRRWFASPLEFVHANMLQAIIDLCLVGFVFNGRIVFGPWSEAPEIAERCDGNIETRIERVQFCSQATMSTVIGATSNHSVDC